MYNWPDYEAVGNGVCSMWESPVLFHGLRMPFSIGGMACYAHFHSARPLAVSRFYMEPHHQDKPQPHNNISPYVVLPGEYISEETEHHRPKQRKQHPNYPEARPRVLQPEQEPKQNDCYDKAECRVDTPYLVADNSADDCQEYAVK